MLHNKKTGIKSVRAAENITRRFADQISNRGYEQRERPTKSPTLKTKKWVAANNSGLVPGLTGPIETVIGGKTA